MESYLIYFTSFISVFTLLFVSYFLYIKLKTERSQQELIKYQRERIENQIYEYNKIMVSEQLRFDDTNHLLIHNLQSDLKVRWQVPDFVFFENLGIDLSKIIIQEGLVACIMPFNRRFDKVFQTIKEACSSSRFVCRRSDEELLESNSNLLKYVVELILKSQVVVAVLDGRNPNVFYEIGIAHSMGKQVILIAENNKRSEIPFNIQSNRLILYNNWGELKEKLGRSLNIVRYVE